MNFSFSGSLKYVAIFIFLVGSTTFGKEFIHRDTNGMPRCIEGRESVLVVWDHHVQKSTRAVFGITLNEYSRQNNHLINSCKEWPYAVPWPEGLRLISDFAEGYSENTRFALRQISDGGEVYHAEKSASEFILKHSQMFRHRSAVDFAQMELDYGSKFTNSVLNSWIQGLLARKHLNTKNCAALIGTCEFYLCHEARHQCGMEGYPIGLGYKYCNRSLFGLLHSMETKIGKQWVVETIQCLQRKLDPLLSQASLACAEIEEKAIESHPECYVESGFCSMPFKDKAKIFPIVKSELFRKGSLSQASKTLSLCASKP